MYYSTLKIHLKKKKSLDQQYVKLARTVNFGLQRKANKIDQAKARYLKNWYVRALTRQGTTVLG